MLTIDEIREQYPGIAIWSDRCIETVYENILEGCLEPITEYLSTINADKTVNTLDNDKVPSVNRISLNKNKDTILISFSHLVQSDLDRINHKMESFGWLPSGVACSKKKGKYSSVIQSILYDKTITGNIVISYEAKYDREVVIDRGSLYHICPDIVYEKIKLVGLTPKSQGKLVDHPSRVYLIKKTLPVDENTFNSMAIALYLNYANKDRVKQMYVLKIDVDKVKDFKFFEDPNYKEGSGVYTYQNIPPYAISLKYKIDV